MIPTMVAFGIATGWWWKVTLVAAPVLWMALLIIGGAINWTWPPSWIIGTLIGGAALGLANAAVGMIVPQAIRAARYLIRRSHASGTVAARY